MTIREERASLAILAMSAMMAASCNGRLNLGTDQRDGGGRDVPVSSGGATGTGGAPIVGASGGTTGTGGIIGTGGETSSGGTMGTGGTIGTGGTMGTGGRAGTGGVVGTGGRGGSGTGGVAGPCVSDASCPLPTLHCDTTGSRTCVPCVNDTHCVPGLSPSPFSHCNTTLHRCVECTVASNCPGNLCIQNICATACGSDSDCPSPATCEDATFCHACEATEPCSGGLTCVINAGLCRPCIAEANCTPMGLHCDTATFRCVACTLPSHCPSPMICDLTLGTCRLN